MSVRLSRGNKDAIADLEDPSSVFEFDLEPSLEYDADMAFIAPVRRHFPSVFDEA